VGQLELLLLLICPLMYANLLLIISQKWGTGGTNVSEFIRLCGLKFVREAKEGDST
jgi:hypothetical protein